jgi:MoaA/NifB/PqqE/SkfB family radical SAM enzyme
MSNELTTNDWKKVIHALRDWLGPFWFMFSGGEPLLRKDIFELCRYAAEQKTYPSLITNGYGFQDLAAKVVSSGLDSVNVSVNGISPHTHDVTRGIEGAFLKTSQFIKEVNRARRNQPKPPKLYLNSILLPLNYTEAEDLVNWVQEEGIDGVHFQPMDPPGSFHSSPIEGINKSSLCGAGGDWYIQNLQSTNKNLKTTVSKLKTLKRNGAPILNSVEDLSKIESYYDAPNRVKNRCKIGVSAFNVDPYGFVRFCFNQNPLGNIKYDSPRTLFLSKKARDTRMQIKHCDRPCHWAIC